MVGEFHLCLGSFFLCVVFVLLVFYSYAAERRYGGGCSDGFDRTVNAEVGFSTLQPHQ